MNLLLPLNLGFLASWAFTCSDAFASSLGRINSRRAGVQFQLSAEATPSSILITFDLDDTLFPIKEVVQEANDAQIRAMHELGYKETTMEQCMVQTRAIRQGLTSPITYTDLRKGAIRAELERLSTGLDDPVLQKQTEQCFDAWLEERHLASERHLFSDAISTMQDLQATFNPYSNLCIGGITNGRGNPLCMTQTLAPYFAYCVSGEDDDVFPHRKPAPQIYEAALDRWRSLQDDGDHPDLWIHVGDCLANDVGASYDVGAEPVWVAPVEAESEEQPSWSTATEKDLKERAILMEAARSKMSGQITSLSQLTGVIESIVQEWSPEKIGLRSKASASSMSS